MGWGEVQVEGACRGHFVYTEPNWQRDGFHTNVRCCAGWRDRMRLWGKKLNKATRMEMEREPELKEFKKVNHNVVELESYEGELGEDYWEAWVKNPYKEERGSFIDHEALIEVAEEVGETEMMKVDEIATMLEFGADIGVKGEGRWPSSEPNNASVYQFGSRVADALQTGVRDGILYGPLKKEELPWEAKISPMTVRLKPNGNARIIMDLSAPHGPKLGGGEACSPNEGMSEFVEFEPVTMAGDAAWRRCMHRAGRPCWFCKADWDMAYKHVSVRSSDHRLQVVEFGGRYFVERCLTFGGGNSPTIYHLPASLLRDWAGRRSGMDMRQVIMQLDDNCGAGPLGSQELVRYREEYRGLAKRIGVRLASEDNPSKAFPPSKEGEVLGLIYDGVKWTWNMPEGKRDRLLVLLGKGIREGELSNEEVQVMAGKINHYASIVGGKFERSLIIHTVKEDKGKLERIVIGKQARVQMTWWLLNMRALGIEGAFITDPDSWFPRWVVELFPDAAGGDTKDVEKGWGCCYPKKMEYVRGVWPKFIHENTIRNGRQYGRSLTLLEGFGGLGGVPVWVEEIVEAGAVALYIDNSGFVWAHTKGSSRDDYIYTLAKCLQDFCTGVGVLVKIFHTGRRTSPGERVADALSKGNMREVEDEWPGAVDMSVKRSVVLDRWIQDPRVDRDLARRLLREVQSRVEVQIGMDYTMEMEEMLGEGRLG